MLPTPSSSSGQDPFYENSSKPKMSALAPVFKPISSRLTTNQHVPTSIRAAPGTIEYLQGIIDEDEMKKSFTMSSRKIDPISIYNGTTGSAGPRQLSAINNQQSQTDMMGTSVQVTTPLRNASGLMGVDVGYIPTSYAQIPTPEGFSAHRHSGLGGSTFETPNPHRESKYFSTTLGNYTPPGFAPATFTPAAPPATSYAMVPVNMIPSPFTPRIDIMHPHFSGSSPFFESTMANNHISPSAGYGSGYNQNPRAYNSYNGSYNMGYHGPQSGYYHGGSNQFNRLANKNRKNGNSNSIHNIVDVGRIRAGLDVRTTVMLRNIPNKITQHQLLAIINESSLGAYDFVYLRIDFSNQCNVGYAFINFLDPLDIIKFVDAHANKKYMFRSEKVAEVSYATIQGRDCLIQKFRNSSVMLEPEFCRPKLFFTRDDLLGRAGQEDPFPASDNASKLKRSCENAENVGLYAPTAGQALRDEQRRRRSQFDRGTTLAEQDELDELLEDEWMLASSPYQSHYTPSSPWSQELSASSG